MRARVLFSQQRLTFYQQLCSVCARYIFHGGRAHVHRMHLQRPSPRCQRQTNQLCLQARLHWRGWWIMHSVRAWKVQGSCRRCLMYQLSDRAIFDGHCCRVQHLPGVSRALQCAGSKQDTCRLCVQRWCTWPKRRSVHAMCRRTI